MAHTEIEGHEGHVRAMISEEPGGQVWRCQCGTIFTFPMTSPHRAVGVEIFDAHELQECGRRHLRGADCGRCTAIALTAMREEAKPAMTINGIPVHVDPNAPDGFNPQFPIAEPDQAVVERTVRDHVDDLQAQLAAAEERACKAEDLAQVQLQRNQQLRRVSGLVAETEAAASELRARVRLLEEGERARDNEIDRLRRDLHSALTAAGHADERAARIVVLEDANRRAHEALDRLRETLNGARKEAAELREKIAEGKPEPKWTDQIDAEDALHLVARDAGIVEMPPGSREIGLAIRSRIKQLEGTAQAWTTAALRTKRWHDVIRRAIVAERNGEEPPPEPATEPEELPF